MKRSRLFIFIGILSLPLIGCSQGESSRFNIGIVVTPNLIMPSQDFQMAATMNESIIVQGSWFLFELRSPETKGSIWVPGQYEGNGVYSAVTKLGLPGDYQLKGHYYAGGGIHFTQGYSLQVSN